MNKLPQNISIAQLFPGEALSRRYPALIGAEMELQPAAACRVLAEQ